jgi:hypothetical protein
MSSLRRDPPVTRLKGEQDNKTPPTAIFRFLNILKDLLVRLNINTIFNQLKMANSTTPQKPWIETPIIESATLSRAAGWSVQLSTLFANTNPMYSRVFLKLELLQPSGSFKSR